MWWRSVVHVGDRWGTGRVEAFSDGVFAIAITLLVLEISVPESGFEDLWQGIADQWPSYLAYATSFLTIGWIWLVHHGIFRRLQYANSWVMRINLLLLMAVAFLPFPTKLLAEAIHDTDAERAAAVFYGATLFVISALISVLWRVIANDRGATQAGGERSGRQGDHRDCDTQPRVLCSRDPDRHLRPQGGRVRLPRDRGDRGPPCPW